MGRLFIQSLSGPKIFKCKCCKVDSASYEDIISKDFQGRYGRAYLFKSVVNICLGPNEDRQLMSGLHTVNDVYCSSCQQILGWRYRSQLQPIHSTRISQYTICQHPVAFSMHDSSLETLEKAYEESQKYKEGNYILEKERMLKEGW